MKTKTEDGAGPSEEEILAGGIMMTVRLREGSPPQFVPREVKVRLIPFTHMRALAKVWGREELEVELYLGLPKGPEAEAFIAGLHPADHAAVMAEGRRLNYLSFAGWSQRSQSAVAAITKETGPEMVGHVVGEMLKTPEGRRMLENRLEEGA